MILIRERLLPVGKLRTVSREFTMERTPKVSQFHDAHLAELTITSGKAVIRESATAVSCPYSLKSGWITTGSSMHTS